MGIAQIEPPAPQAEDLDKVERLLLHFEQLEAQFQQVREGLTRSHRLATLGTIASVIAHEYNNILTPVISYAQLALAQPDDHELSRKAVEKALAGAERAAKISASLLGLAREADEEHAAPVRQIIDEAINCIARDPKKDGIDLVIDVPDVKVEMPPLNLQQVLLNLVLNAKKVMRRKGGRLTITGRADGSLLHLDVADTGPGIPDAIRNRLFEPFVTHRTDAGEHSPERKGTGLGLCICRDLIRNAGGTIDVDSVPGQGATFHLVIPLADDLFETT